MSNLISIKRRVTTGVFVVPELILTKRSRHRITIRKNLLILNRGINLPMTGFHEQTLKLRSQFHFYLLLESEPCLNPTALWDIFFCRNPSTVVLILMTAVLFPWNSNDNLYLQTI